MDFANQDQFQVDSAPDEAAPSSSTAGKAKTSLRDDAIAQKAESLMNQLSKRAGEVNDRVSPDSKLQFEQHVELGLMMAEGKKQNPSNRQFGKWLRDNGMTKGYLSDQRTRSAILWLAQNHDEKDVHGMPWKDQISPTLFDPQHVQKAMSLLIRQATGQNPSPTTHDAVRKAIRRHIEKFGEALYISAVVEEIPNIAEFATQ